MKEKIVVFTIWFFIVFILSSLGIVTAFIFFGSANYFINSVIASFEDLVAFYSSYFWPIIVGSILAGLFFMNNLKNTEK